MDMHFGAFGSGVGDGSAWAGAAVSTAAVTMPMAASVAVRRIPMRGECRPAEQTSVAIVLDTPFAPLADRHAITGVHCRAATPAGRRSAARGQLMCGSTDGKHQIHWPSSVRQV